MVDGVSWWRGGVIYQLLVPSYYDSNGDGIGDLPGAAQKLEYLEWLGVDAVWLSPIYSTPFLELGYDVKCYTDVYDRFGTLADFDEFVDEAHRRSLRVILDWVPNHTSSEHPWFSESRSARDSPKRDWYIWHDGKEDGSPPTNWLGIFGGSVWAFDEPTGQWYMHTFLEEQPDLNWRNREMREAMYDAMRFWLKRGVDGFRIDALDLLVEDDALRDNPPNPDYDPSRDGPDMALVPEHTRNHPCDHEITAEMRRVIDEYDDRVLLGELYLGPELIAAYYGQDDPELHLPLNPIFTSVSWSPESLAEAIEGYLAALPQEAWPSWMVSTHDGRRVASRAGWQQAGAAALLLLTLRGTPVVYYGDEIGMQDVDVPAERQVDPQGKLIGRKRDPVRTPMQWDAGAHGGFSNSKPWLPVGPSYADVNVNVQSGRTSLLEFFRRLLAIRRSEEALVCGTMSGVRSGDGVLSYQREGASARMEVVLNLTSETRAVETSGRILLSTYLDRDEEVGGRVEVRPNEGILIRSENT